MAVSVVIGSQWGDEGKGKVIDFLSPSVDFVVRFHGGNNAGHTVKNRFGTFPLHLIPSGIFSSKTKSCISHGVVLDLDVLCAEIDLVSKAGISLINRLFISPRCHIIMPYHKNLERIYEDAKGKGKTGTTGRGIGPVYADKVSYNGIRLSDLLDKKLFSEKLAVQLAMKNKIIQAFSGKPLRQKVIEDHYFALIEKLRPYIVEPYPLLHKALKHDRAILLEGAHGVFLDTDWGTYPFVTASTVLSGGITAGAGLPPASIRHVIGVVKAYTTRVGAGPFPTELLDGTGERLQEVGREFGTTTGRSRRCGWLDLELIRFAAEVNGFTSLAVTKLDVLDGFSEIKICTGYSLRGQRVSYYDGDSAFLASVKPVYKIMKGWKVSTKGITSFEKLPVQAKRYINEIERQTGIPVTYISTGPDRKETIIR